LLGSEPQKQSSRNFIIGIYPMLKDETCKFLAVDFDKESWREDASAFMDSCEKFSIHSALERSRSGQGGHVWIFFSEPVKAVLARKLGTFLITETMENRPEICLDSYDRFFPSQDTMPLGGFGNLIALPLQKKPREKGNTLFIDHDFIPYEDQWAYLSSLQRTTNHDVKAIVNAAMQLGDITGIKTVITEEDDALPWQQPPSRQIQEKPIQGPLPEKVQLVLGNQIYIEKALLPAALQNRLIRIAAFQNPEFYKNQAMRLPSYDKPRIIHCCEDFPKHIGLPRGCLDEVTELLQSFSIKPHLVDERFSGIPIDCTFTGDLRSEQKLAATEMLRRDTGVLSATTAFGKTIIAIYMLAQRGVNTLILVHRRQLLDQWIARLQTFLNIDPKDIGQIGGGKRKPTGIIDVAVIQSLSKKGVVDDIVGEYGYLIVDECHHVSARSFEIVARECKAQYVTGLSATVVRKDGHHPIIFINCGPIRYNVDPRKQAALRPFTHKVSTRKTHFIIPSTFLNIDSLKMNDLYVALSVDESRNQMIVDDILQALEEKRSPLVLSERREHLETLVNLLSPHVKNILVFKGGMGKKQRQKLSDQLQNIPENEERIIVATGRYLGEGFDDSRLDTLFLTLPISWKGTLSQ
jgi:superfamily II DNA or RNA helicase